MKAVCLRSDVVRPRRLMMLREDVGGVIHWACLEFEHSATAVPYCSSGARLAVFFRTPPEKPYEMPTCFWCIQETTTWRRK